MKKMIGGMALLAVLGLSAPISFAAPIVLTLPAGGTVGQTITGLTFGSSLSFDYQFEVTGSFVQLTANIINAQSGPDSNPFVSVYGFSGNTGWGTATLATNGIPNRVGVIGDLSFFSDSYGDAGKSGTIRIQDIRIDNVVVGAPATTVPEPATLALLGIGLAGLGFARRKRAA